jgi:hypothetical protein
LRATEHFTHPDTVNDWPGAATGESGPVCLMIVCDGDPLVVAWIAYDPLCALPTRTGIDEVAPVASHPYPVTGS